MKGIRFFGVLFAAVLVLLLVAVPVSASISPTEFTATLNPGESATVTKTVTIPAMPAKADVVFSFDLTGSMGGIIDTAKAQAGAIMTALDATGVDINYGVASYMDYPHSYDSYGYAAQYGASSGDYAYRLNQAVTSNRPNVQNAINALVLGAGADGPQDYARIMYESYSDSNITWRPGALKILVNFGDSVPHDNNVNEGIYATVWSTGGDPGRDEVMFTADDIDLQTVLQGMKDNGVTLLECQTYGAYSDYWTYWTGITGGQCYSTDAGTLPADVESAITAKLTITKVYGLHLAASAGFESWISATPASYAELSPGDTVTFDLTITVPAGTTEGVYNFTTSAVDSSGTSYGDETDTIQVGAVENTGPLTWQLDSEEQSTLPPPGIAYEMERTEGPGDNGQSGQVGIAKNGGSAIWIADEVCTQTCWFASSGEAAWKVEIATEADWGVQGSKAAFRVGEWNATTGFRPFGTVVLLSVEWNAATNAYIFKIMTQPGNEVVNAGNYLALEITNNDVKDHTVYTGEGPHASCLTDPQTSPLYPTPELPTAALLGVGLLGLLGIGYLGWRRHMVSA